MRRHGSRIDDGAALPLAKHLFSRCLRRQENACQIDPDHFLPLLIGHLRRGNIQADPGIAERDVQFTEGVQYFLRHPVHFRGRSDIRPDCDHSGPVLRKQGGCFLGFFKIDIHQGHVRPCLCQGCRDAFSDPPGSAGNKGFLAIQAHSFHDSHFPIPFPF